MKIILAGAGKLGFKLAEELVAENIDVTIVDKDVDVIKTVNNAIDVLTVKANVLDFETLKELDIDTFDILIATTENDETNILTCAIAKRLGCKSTIARVRDPELDVQRDLLKQTMGIDLIINPEKETATSIFKYLMKRYGSLTDSLAHGLVKLVDFKITGENDLIGKTLAEIDTFKNLLVTAISRNGLMIVPDGSTSLEIDDVIYLIGKSADIDGFYKHNTDFKSHGLVNRVMIMGGGNVGLYLADMLCESGLDVTIVEIDEKKCRELKQLLPHCLIINGDATDPKLLEDEDIDDMDAFVGLTGFDEQNLLMALTAKHYGVGKVVAKISRPNYTRVVDKLDIDAAFNPAYITASNILKRVRGGRAVSVYLMLGGEAEVLEIKLDKDLDILNKSLKELNLPKGIIIGSVIEHGKAVIPNGDTVLRKHQKIIIFCLKDNVSTVKKIFMPKPEEKGGILREFWRSI